jgi:hypothetical protein
MFHASLMSMISSVQKGREITSLCGASLESWIVGGMQQRPVDFPVGNRYFGQGCIKPIKHHIEACPLP